MDHTLKDKEISLDVHLRDLNLYASSYLISTLQKRKKRKRDVKYERRRFVSSSSVESVRKLIVHFL